MANPNPFLFGAPAPGGGQPPNPYMAGGAPPGVANPFGGMAMPQANPFGAPAGGVAMPQANPFGAPVGGMAAPPMHQPQHHYGAYGTPQPPVDAANPFAASFGAPPPSTQPSNSPFGNTSSYYPQSVPPQQPQHQQHHGQFGQYSQVTAGNFSQPNVTPSAQPPPAPEKMPEASKVNPFAAAIDDLPPAEVVNDNKSASNDVTLGATDAISSSQDEMPPPPPMNLMQEDTKVPPEKSADEALPPPPKQESITDDDPLPPPPVTSEVIQDVTGVTNTNTVGASLFGDIGEPITAPVLETKNSDANLIDTIANVQITDCQMPEITVDISQPSDGIDPISQNVTDKKSDNEESSGFGGIFSNDLLDTGDTIKASVSVSDLTPEKDEELEKEVDVSKDNDLEDSPTEAVKEETKCEDVTVKANSIGASLFGGAEDPVTVSANETDYLESNFNQKTASSSSSESNTPQKPPMSQGDAIFADMTETPQVVSTGATIFGMSDESAKDTTGAAIFGVEAPRSIRPQLGQMTGWDDAFDQKFDTAITQEIGDAFDPFGASGLEGNSAQGFGADEFISGNFPATANTAAGIGRREDAFGQAPMTDDLNNPFLSSAKPMGVDEPCDGPLYDDDTSKPLEPYPRLKYDGTGWEMYIRHPPKKKMTAQRFWKKVFVRLQKDKDNNPCVQLFETKDSKDAFQELPLQPAYSLSEIGHQVFDQYSKLFTVKLQYIFYKEQAGIRPGQITKMQKLTGKIGFLAKAVEDADLKGVKEFASDMKKLGIPMEHSPQVSELLKLASTSYEDLKQFTVCVEEKLFRMPALRDRSLTYKTEEVQMTAVDEVYVEQNKAGTVLKQIARVRVFFISFLSDMPEVEVGVNDITRMGLEVVGRHDILPVPTEQWIRYENIEFHPVVDRKEFEKPGDNHHIIKFQPPDACYLELFRFRVRPPRARELPMQARCTFIMQGTKVEIRADMMIPYHHTKAFGQVPCEDVAMRIPIPEAWIYQFRNEKAHVSFSQLAAGNLNLSSRMGAVKSAHRRAGKVKGLERFLGTLETQTQELMETSSGQAKYEHQHKAIVWRVPRLPKHGQGSYTNHEFVCKITLASYDQMPENFDKNFYVEFTQPATCVSHTVLRNVSIQGGSGEPPEKFVKYLARHEYKLEIDFTEKEVSSYKAAVKKAPEPEPEPEPEGDAYFPSEKRTEDSDSDSD